MKSEPFPLSLEDFSSSLSLSLDEILPLARALVRELGRYHNQRLFHGRLQPRSIIPPASWREGGAFPVRLADEEEVNPAYAAPEQSGRLGGTADYRCDFYSLGVVLYELYTGKRPFERPSAVQMVHAHLSRLPGENRPHQDRRERAFLGILSRLMKKEPGDRYQSCYDILSALEALEAGREPAGPSRGGGGLIFPDSGFARERERALLAEAEERVRAGKPSLVVLTGEAGSGKTTLVRHHFREVSSRKGVFVPGKFDALQPLPYEGFRTAVKELVRQFLGRGDDEIREIRERLSASLLYGRKILLNLFPEAAPFIAEDPSPLPRAEDARNLTALLVPRFFAAFADPDQPLILFLDDLQWAEDDSLALINQMARTALPGVLMILAWRDPHDRGLSWKPLEDPPSGVLPPLAVRLTPLTVRRTEDLLSALFPVAEIDIQVLATLVHAKSSGNPLFIRVYLQALEKEGLLSFDHLRGVWEGDLRRIAEAEPSSGVADFLVERMTAGSAEEKSALMMAACLGSSFETDLLAELLSCPPEAVFGLLKGAREAGLVLPERSLPGGGYAFLHDRVRQAAYALLDEEARPGIHRRIGALLEARGGDLFRAVYHYQQALSTLSSSQERLHLRRLNQEAAVSAKNSAAFDLLYRCLGTVLFLWDDDGWESDYSGTLALYTDAAEAALLVFQFDAAEEYAGQIDSHARDVYDSLAAAHIRIRSFMARHRMREAFIIATRALDSLGFPLPRRCLGLHSLVRPLWTGRRLGRLKQSWQDLPPMTRRRDLHAMRILIDVASSSYIAVPEAFPLVACLMVNLHLRRGWTPSFAFSLALFANILTDRPGKGKLALRIDQTIEEMEHAGKAGEDPQKIQFFINSMCRVWLRPLETTLEPLHQGYIQGREKGDFEYALLCGQFFYLHSLFCCRNLGDLHEGLQKCTALARELSQTRSIYATNRLMQFYLNLTNKNTGGSVLTGDYFDEEKDLSHLQEVNDQCGLGTVRIYKMILALLLGEYQEAADLSDEAAPYIPALRGEYLVALWWFHSGLAWAALGGEENLRRLNRVVKKLKTQSRRTPENFKHQYQLLQAERLRLSGRHDAAVRLYKASSGGAEDCRFFLDAALARERLSWCCRDQGRSSEAEEALTAARDAFRDYGCLLKVADLEEKHPFLKSRLSGPALDANSVVEAARAISAEMDPLGLAERLLSIVIENSGATRGILFLVDRDELKPQAEGVSGPSSIRISHRPGPAAFPGTILRYVRRTGETVALANGGDQMPFGPDDYLAQFRVLSVLCVPLLHRNGLKGLLYLENHLITGAFPAERAHLAGTIAAQAAVSLENARLYQSLLEDMEARQAAEKEVLAAKERERDHQRQLMEADKLSSLGMLAAGVAHEVNNPNHIVRLNAALLESAGSAILSLLDEAVGEETSLLLGGLEYSAFRQQFPRILSDIRECSERIDIIVRELKSYAGQPTTGPSEQVDMNSVAAAALRLCQPLTKKATNHLFFLPGEDLPPVCGVTQQLEQVVINLIQNACYALTSPDQSIRVKTERDEESGALVLTVADEGRGIPSGLTSRILEPFFTTRRESGGTGLGLSVSRKIVKEHGGTLDIASEEGRGTCVTITLPAGERP